VAVRISAGSAGMGLRRRVHDGDHASVRTRPTLHLTVGLPGVGKTTWARQLAADCCILRLSPDDWMAPLFRDSEAGGRRDVLEGRMIWVADRVLRSGSSVVLDFGCWSAHERYAIRTIADHAGAGFVLHHLELDERERRIRATHRCQAEARTTFPMSDADHDRFLRSFEPPSDAELVHEPVPDPPAGFGSWLRWASHRWPTLPRLDEAASA